jgi:hypothetical protein
MFEAKKTLGIIWTAMILTYGIIAIALVTTRWTFRTLKRASFKIGHCEIQIRPLRVKTGQPEFVSGMRSDGGLSTRLETAKLLQWRMPALTRPIVHRRGTDDERGPQDVSHSFLMPEGFLRTQLQIVNGP